MFRFSIFLWAIKIVIITTHLCNYILVIIQFRKITFIYNKNLTFSIFGDDPAPILYDHGRAFGRHKVDDYVILGPLLHCCIVKESTLAMLLK